MRSPIVWFGGKGLIARHIVPLLPAHQTYVEPFAGGASVFFAKAPSPVEVLNDLDGGLINFYRVIRDPATFEQFHRFVSLTPHSRAEYQSCVERWRDCADPVEKAARWFVMVRQSFAGRLDHGWALSIGCSVRGRANAVNAWLMAIEGLPAVHKRLSHAQIDNLDWLRCLDRYDTPDTLFYVDPPYIASTRLAGGYAHEMTDADHQALINALLSLKGKAILSGYPHRIHEPLEAAGWMRTDRIVVTRAAGRTRATGLQGDGATDERHQRTESLWLSPSAQSNAKQLSLELAI